MVGFDAGDQRRNIALLRGGSNTTLIDLNVFRVDGKDMSSLLSLFEAVTDTISSKVTACDCHTYNYRPNNLQISCSRKDSLILIMYVDIMLLISCR